MTHPRAPVRWADAALPLNILANDEGFISLIDAKGYFVLTLTPIQIAAIARAVAVATEPPPWLGQPIPKGPARPSLCSTCHGDCCVNKRGNVVEHRSALALHSCRDCLDGFAPALGGHTAEQKRASVDAYLRAPDESNDFKPCPLCGSTIPDEPNELDALRAEVERLRGEVERERAAVVAFRQEAARYRGLEPVLSPAARALEATAYLIETHAPDTMDSFDPPPVTR